ncbi:MULTISPECIES: type I-D CRISPR-associated protein Csc2 [unclassified Marichromatium]|uniref:type I-D CRISPR-associated protein Csc2 n=1 Tax=unclassified Marichromatium TaxID=2618417 RepID=UPI000F3B089F|nr:MULTISPECIES: type I-D CRISPR-associated protein Csc2 [unclassified Marichromatium]MBO8086603.1 type I-D CRISPR-associated protein Csc2 [Marichromatium sp.]RNE89025.1 type I-D CRISPR-associated protein Csc2 [Marichromatium sp. AB31]RNE92612.1 type I-D CRISPR-associated protein Csc2 [Marichromatium sp. AB32]
MERLNDYLAPLNGLLEKTQGDNSAYLHPKRKNLGSISLVLIREAIAPVVFRNAEQEITDIEFNDETYVRAVPNKFKYPERGRALQILRAMGAGGRYPQNRTVIPKKAKPSESFDLNTLVFGDSANSDNKVLPVRAAVNYSDGLSLRPKYLCVDESFHNRGMEDGTLWDAEDNKNTDNLFSRHFIRPGSLMVQVLSTRGKMLPAIGLKHLLLSVGMAGSYGGQTSVTGINIRTHCVGIYADKFEKAETSPYELIKHFDPAETTDVETATARLHNLLAPLHQTVIPGQEVQGWVEQLVDDFNQPGGRLEAEYKEAATEIAQLFDGWFGK